jgi:hypothetical protein
MADTLKSWANKTHLSYRQVQIARWTSGERVCMPIFNTISDNTIHKNQLLFMTWSDTDAPRGGVTNEYNLFYVHPFHTWEEE